MSKTGGGIGTNQYQIKGRSVAVLDQPKTAAVAAQDATVAAAEAASGAGGDVEGGDEADRLWAELRARALGYEGPNLSNEARMRHLPTKTVRMPGDRVKGNELGFVVDGKPVAVAQGGPGNVNVRVEYVPQSHTKWQLVDGTEFEVSYYDTVEVVVVDQRAVDEELYASMTPEEAKWARDRAMYLRMG